MDTQLEIGSQAFSKMIMHAMKHPHSTCTGLLLSPRSDDTRIIDAIPISHHSHYLAPNNEVAINSVSTYAQEQELVISGYYQTENKSHEPMCINPFAQRVTEKISENYPNAVLCFVSIEDSTAQTILDLLHLVDGKWRRRPPQSFKIEDEPEVLANSVLYSKEKLFRQIVDFDDHFDNISLDWTNAQISRRIDYLIANVY